MPLSGCGRLLAICGATKSLPTHLSPTTTTLHGSLPVCAGAHFVALTAVLISQFGSLQSRILRFLRKYSPFCVPPETAKRSSRKSSIYRWCSVVADGANGRFSVCHALGHRGQRPRLQHGSQSRGYRPSPRRTPNPRTQALHRNASTTSAMRRVV
jgi:hypothetical protein